jgi:hypothetical protein
MSPSSFPSLRPHVGANYREGKRSTDADLPHLRDKIVYIRIFFQIGGENLLETVTVIVVAGEISKKKTPNTSASRHLTSNSQAFQKLTPRSELFQNEGLSPFPSHFFLQSQLN